MKKAAISEGFSVVVKAVICLQFFFRLQDLIDDIATNEIINRLLLSIDLASNLKISMGVERTNS